MNRDAVEIAFGDGIEDLDFRTDTENSRLHINSLVGKATKNQIKNLFPPNTIDPMATMVLANAAYFKGSWKNEATVSKPFYGTKTANIEMMTITGLFKYRKTIRLDYK